MFGADWRFLPPAESSKDVNDSMASLELDVYKKNFLAKYLTYIHLHSSKDIVFVLHQYVRFTEFCFMNHCCMDLEGGERNLRNISDQLCLKGEKNI